MDEVAGSLSRLRAPEKGGGVEGKIAIISSDFPTYEKATENQDFLKGHFLLFQPPLTGTSALLFPLSLRQHSPGVWKECLFFFSFKQHPRIAWIAPVQFSSVARWCPTLCDTMNHIMPGLPVHHQLLEFTQTHVHWVSDGIQPSHPLSSPSPPALNLSQHQGLFQWVSSLHQVAKLLEFQLQHQSFQWTPRIDL